MTTATPRKTARRSACVALLLAIGAAACVPNIEEPSVRLVGVRVGGLGLEGGVLYVRLGVINPNDFDLGADGLTYRVELRATGDDAEDWTTIAEGEYEEDLRVASNDSTVLEIPVEFRYAGLGGAVRSILATGTLDYRVRGSVAVEAPLRVDFPYRHEGTVSLTRSE